MKNLKFKRSNVGEVFDPSTADTILLFVNAWN